MTLVTQNRSEVWRMALVFLLGAHNTWSRAAVGDWVTALWAGAAITVVGLWAVYREKNIEVRANSLDWLLTMQVLVGFA